MESVDLALDVYAVGPTQSQHGKEHKVARVVLDLLPHIKALSGFQPWQSELESVLLMVISPMPIPEVLIEVMELLAAHRIFESIVHLVAHKNNLSRCLDLIGVSAFIHALSRNQLLCGSVSVDLFPSCVMLSSGAISIPDSLCVMPCLVVVTARMESEVSLNASYFVVLLFKVCSMFNIIEVAKERVKAQTNQQVQQIHTGYNERDDSWFGENY